MQCEICEKETYTLRKFEDLNICVGCQKDLGVYIDYQSIGIPIRRKSNTRANIHINGSQAAPPRPYGQLPGNGSY